MNCDLLPDLCLERICVCSPFNFRFRPNRSSVHPNNHRGRRSGLASCRGRSHDFPGACNGIHNSAPEAFASRHHVWSRTQMSTFVQQLLRLRRGPWEIVASILIAIGVIMLMQPFALFLFSYSFIVTLIGTVMFIIVSHFPE